jgi:hypothetical protein
VSDEERPEERIEPGGDGPDVEAPMDTGAPPGVYPNSDVPDPRVAGKEAEEPGEEELHERYGAGTPPAGPDPVEQPGEPGDATAD